MTQCNPHHNNLFILYNIAVEKSITIKSSSDILKSEKTGIEYCKRMFLPNITNLLLVSSEFTSKIKQDSNEEIELIKNHFFDKYNGAIAPTNTSVSLYGISPGTNENVMNSTGFDYYKTLHNLNESYFFDIKNDILTSLQKRTFEEEPPSKNDINNKEWIVGGLYVAEYTEKTHKLLLSKLQHILPFELNKSLEKTMPKISGLYRFEVGDTNIFEGLEEYFK